MNLVLVISHLGCGGAERVITLMANYWAEQGHETHLITLAKRGTYCAYPIDERVRITSAQDGAKKRLGKPSKLWALRRQIMRIGPSAVISFGDATNVLVLLALIGTPIKVTVSERSNPEFGTMSSLYRLGRRVLYPRAHALVSQTNNVRDWFLQHGYRVRGFVIHNPILSRDNRECDSGEQSGTAAGEKTILAVGRLVPVKGFDRLIRIFRGIVEECPGWALVIVGEGPERENLERLIGELDLRPAVRLVGRVENPVAFMRTADIFAFTSHYEGFPNALCEAMATGLPVVSFDCPSGPSDIIEGGRNGILVENGDEEQFARKLMILINSPELRREYGIEARKITRTLAIGAIMKQWEAVVAHKQRPGVKDS